jgi:hypothetical protein
MPKILECEPELEHQAHSATAAGAATDTVVYQRDVQICSAAGYMPLPVSSARR